MQLDEPSGSNDGSIKGSRKFQCPDKYGAFVRGANVAVGDFPELDIFGSDDEEKDVENKDNGNTPKPTTEAEDEDQDEF